MCDNNCFYQEYELEPYIPPPEYDCRDCRNWNKRPRTEEPDQPAEVSSGVVTVEKPTRPGTTTSSGTTPGTTGSTSGPSGTRPRSNRSGQTKECPACTSSWYDPSLLTPPPQPSGTYNPSQYDPENPFQDQPFQDQMYDVMGWPEPLPPGNQMIRGRRPPIPPGFNLPPETSLPNAFSRPPQLPRPPPALTQPANTYTEFQPYRYPDPPALAPAIPPQIESCFPPPPPDMSNVLFNDYGFPEDNLGEPPIEPPSNICKTIELNNEYEENVDSWFSETAPPPPPPPPPPPECTSTWVEVASEGQTVTFTQQVDVAFGYNIDGSELQPSAYRYNVTGPITFSNEGFGSSLLGSGKKGWFRCAITTPPVITGCMDPLANNYNPQATVSDGSCTYNPGPTGTGQYTPDYSRTPYTPVQRMIASTAKAKTSNPGGQDPDSIPWMTPAHWAVAAWDGTPFDLTGKTKEQICAWLAPSGSGQAIRGLREHFYAVQPFADNKNPTITEINNWNLEVIKHIRNLFGITIPIKNDARLYLECAWADERKFTDVWNVDYPGPFFPDNAGSSTFGPCVVGDNRLVSDHCGASFYPNTGHRTPYITAPPYNNDFTVYPELNGNGPGSVYGPVLTTTGYTARRGATEGVRSIEDTHSWTLKLAQIFKRWICAEGPTGHAGPFLSRTEVGMSWWHEPGQAGDIVKFRGKWAG